MVVPLFAEGYRNGMVAAEVAEAVLGLEVQVPEEEGTSRKGLEGRKITASLGP
jgi:hypothetical protein